MSRVPSFNNPQKLREAVTPIVSDIRGPMSPHIEATIQLVIKYFMSGGAQAQAHRIRSARQFKAVVTTLIREVDKKIEELSGVALQVARRRYRGQNAQYIEDLVQHVHNRLLTEDGDPHIFDNTKTLGWSARTFVWWMSDELERLNQFHNLGRRVKNTRNQAEDDSSQDETGSTSTSSTRQANQPRMVYVSDQAQEDPRGSWIENLPDTSDLAEKLAAEALIRTHLEAIKPHLFALPKKRRSAVISREWYALRDVIPKEELAEHVISPLPLNDRIKLLDSIVHDQTRMWGVKYPSLLQAQGHVGHKKKLATLNRASTHGINALQDALKKTP